MLANDSTEADKQRAIPRSPDRPGCRRVHGGVPEMRGNHPLWAELAWRLRTVSCSECSLSKVLPHAELMRISERAPQINPHLERPPAIDATERFSDQCVPDALRDLLRASSALSRNARSGSTACRAVRVHCGLLRPDLSRNRARLQTRMERTRMPVEGVLERVDGVAQYTRFTTLPASK